MPPIVINGRGDVRQVAAIGTGDVLGPATSTDNAVATYDGTDGKHLQDSLLIVSPGGVISGVTADVALINTGLMALVRGGTHTDLSGTGGANRVVMQESSGADLTVRVLASGDIPNLPGSKINSSVVGSQYGGTGQDFSAASGLVKATAGTFSVVAAPSGAVVGDTDTQTLSDKTLTTPTISATGWVNANHAHLAANSGGTLDVAAIASGTFPLARVVSGSAGNRQVATAFSGDAVLTLRNMGAYEYQPWTVLGADTPSISISSIPGTHNLIYLVVTLRTDKAAQTFDSLLARINGDTTVTDYFGLQGTITSTASSGVNNLGATATFINGAAAALGASATANYFAEYIIQIANYANTSNYRTITWDYYVALAETAGNLIRGAGGCIWKNTANAITSISFAPGTASNLKSGSGYGLWLL